MTRGSFLARWIVLALLSCTCMHLAIADENRDSTGWPQWRGPIGNGVAIDASPPTTWSPSQNVKWKIAIPGKGHSSPIVWKNQVFVTTAVPVGEKYNPKMSGRPGEHDNLPITTAFEFSVLAIDRADGKIAWSRTVHQELPLEAGHVTGSMASASPVTDGSHLYAYFGSFGLYCLELDGKLKWSTDFGTMHSKHGHGEGSSPALFGNSLFINWDHEEGSFVVAIDKSNGAERWRTPRSEDTSWSSPVVIDNDGKHQLVVCGTNRVCAYDLENGNPIWECRGMSSNVVATPVYANGILYVGSSYEKRVLMAIDVRGARGDITGTARVKWERTRGTPYVPSMLLYEDSLYFLTHYQNMLTRVHGPTGRDAPGAFRVGTLGNIYSSPVAANQFIYVTDLNGQTAVITHSDIPRIVAVNSVDEPVSSTLAIAGNEIWIRGETHLFCIAEPSS